MFEVISSLTALIVGLFSALFSVAVLVVVHLSEALYHFHISMPRLEGLLVGVLLTWLLLRREKHPILKVLSAPLKLVLDILDLAWDQAVEAAQDLWATVKGWSLGLWSWKLSKIKGAYGAVIGGLLKVKDKLTSKKD